MDNDKPVSTDVESTENQAAESHEETGGEDVEGKGEGIETLTLEDINSVLKRDFKTKEEALKSLDGLKRLVGDQELAKERKEKKNQESDNTPDVVKEIQNLKQEIKRKDFLAENPTAKGIMDIMEAYAEKTGISLEEAWEQKFKEIAESSQRKVLTNKNRNTPVQSEEIQKLSEAAAHGNPRAQEDLVKKLVWKK